MVITELGVFELQDGGMVLTEIGVFFEVFKASFVGNYFELKPLPRS